MNGSAFIEMNEIKIYKTADNQTEIEVRFDGDTVWLTQYQLAELFQTDRTAILKHLQNIYSTNELEEKSTCAKIAQVRSEGTRKVKREVLHYNLDAISQLEPYPVWFENQIP